MVMDKIQDPYCVMLEQLRVIDQSIYVINLVNNDLREILHKHKPLPKFINDSFKQTIINKSKTSAVQPTPPPIETEEIRLAASVIDKAKRTIENVGEKKSKQSSTVIAPIPTPVPPSTNRHSRPKTSSSARPSSAGSTIPTRSDSSVSQQQQQQPQPVRRYVPAHMKAPFLTQPEKKRRPTSATRNNSQTNSNQRGNLTRRSISQQRRQSATPTTQSIVKLPPQTSIVPLEPNEQYSTTDDQNMNGNNHEDIFSEHTSVTTTAEEEQSINIPVETIETDLSPIPQPIILNRALIIPLRRLWKQNRTLRVRIKRELEKKSTSTPLFINRLNEQIYSPIITDEIHIPNIEILLQLANKLRAIVLYLLENSTFDDLDGALKRLTTLKYLVKRYQVFFTSKLQILVAKHHYHRPSNLNINIEEYLNKSKSSSTNRNTVLYSDDGQLIAFTEVRFKQFENQCRWIELNWHEQMINQFQKTLSNKNQNILQIYRELMSLVTGLQTSTPIVVENRFE